MTILLSIVILVLVAIICYLCEANQRLAQRANNYAASSKHKTEKLRDIAECSPIRYSHIVNGNGYHEIVAEHINATVLVKRFMDSDDDYNQMCAEELIDKLNE